MVDDELVREIAEEAEAHPVSVLRRLLGLPVRGYVSNRIDYAIAVRKLANAGERCPAPVGHDGAESTNPSGNTDSGTGSPSES